MADEHGTLQRYTPLASVLVMGAVGVVLASVFKRPVRGCAVISGACLLAALLRLVLSERRAGLLAVRGRALDVAMLTTTGTAILLLTLSLRSTYRS